MYQGALVPKMFIPPFIPLKKKYMIQFVDWYPTGFQVIIRDQTHIVIPEVHLAKVQSMLKT